MPKSSEEIKMVCEASEQAEELAKLPEHIETGVNIFTVWTSRKGLMVNCEHSTLYLHLCIN